MSYLLQFDLAEDLALPGCPLCRAASRHSREYLRTLMAADINDERVRQQLRRTGGMCREHLLLGVEVAAEQADPMGMALLAEFLLEVAEQTLRRVGSVRGRRRRIHGPRRAGSLAACPACDAQAVVLDGYAALLLRSPQEDVRAMLASGDRGLCLPHCLGAIERVGTASEASTLVAAWTRQARRLRLQLAELSGK